MAESKVSELSKVRVEDVLADFFMKKMTKEEHKKHKKKKKKYTHHSSSSSEESAVEKRSSKHKRKKKARFRSYDRRRSHSSSSLSPQHKKKSKHKHRSFKKNSKHCKDSDKEHSHSEDSVHRKKEPSDSENLKEKLTEEIHIGNEDYVIKLENRKIETGTTASNAVVVRHHASNSPVHESSQQVSKQSNTALMKSALCSVSTSTKSPEIVADTCESMLKSSTPQFSQLLSADKSEHSKQNDDDAKLADNKIDFTEKQKRQMVLEEGKQICSPMLESSRPPSVLTQDTQMIREKNNCSLLSDVPVKQEPEVKRNEKSNSQVEKQSTNCETNLSIPDPEVKNSCDNPKKEANCAKNDTDSSKLKQKLSLLKRQELLEKFTKHEEMYKEFALSKAKGKSGETSEKYEKDSSKCHSNKRKHQSKDHYRDSDEDDFSRKHHKTSYKKSKDRHGKHSPCKSPTSDRGQSINKAKLLEVARKNALQMMEKGTLPQGISTEMLKKNHVAIKAGGKSVKELTDFCRNLSSKEGVPSDTEQDAKTDLDENEQPFIHHPFKLKEPSVIKMVIKNSVQLPVKSHTEKVTENARMLSLQFPVSSGNQHRQKELEWIPVEKDESVSNKPVASATEKSVHIKTVVTPKLHNSPAAVQVTTVVSPMPTAPSEPVSSPSCSTFQVRAPQEKEVSSTMYSVEPPPIRTPIYNSTPTAGNARGSFNFDVQACVVKRWTAIMKLKQNQFDIEAANELSDAQMQIQAWIESQQVPGQFTGQTDAKLLTAEELSGPRPVWVKKDTFTRAAPVTEGKGMSLLRKMGWNPGEGLGKNKEGSLEPVFLNIKMDKRGLHCPKDEPSPRSPAVLNCNKHPVSVLMELCSKKKWEPPLYIVVDDSGPPHKKSFLFKVKVNNREYQPSMSRSSKKQAKADAATLCLQELGIPPSEYKN